MLVAIVLENWDDPADHISLAVIQPKSLPLSLFWPYDGYRLMGGELVIILISHQIISLQVYRYTTAALLKETGLLGEETWV